MWHGKCFKAVCLFLRYACSRNIFQKQQNQTKVHFKKCMKTSLPLWIPSSAAPQLCTPCCLPNPPSFCLMFLWRLGLAFFTLLKPRRKLALRSAWRFLPSWSFQNALPGLELVVQPATKYVGTINNEIHKIPRPFSSRWRNTPHCETRTWWVQVLPRPLFGITRANSAAPNSLDCLSGTFRRLSRMLLHLVGHANRRWSELVTFSNLSETASDHRCECPNGDDGFPSDYSPFVANEHCSSPMCYAHAFSVLSALRLVYSMDTWRLHSSPWSPIWNEIFLSQMKKYHSYHWEHTITITSIRIRITRT